ncbi:DNAse I-like superfamily protein [Striga asiatica]|uniref:DNAse I-like superfamily protein n=1 Tax=Striga asiatica TaxID=4170 RepID=A0A5A7PFJ2_STRAF|nr:DNAse I-like superfamily protein [Striga asiatica]
MGDRNDLRTADDKVGGMKRSSRSFMGFNSFINNMAMNELPMLGYQFTWCNLRSEEGLVEKKLDKAFASMEWTQTFPNATVSNRVRSSSDHSLLLLNMGQQQHKRTTRFHFDKRWIGMEGFKETVEAAWSHQTEGTPFYKLKEKLETLRKDKSDNYWDQWNTTSSAANEPNVRERKLVRARSCSFKARSFNNRAELEHEIELVYYSNEHEHADTLEIRSQLSPSPKSPSPHPPDPVGPSSSSSFPAICSTLALKQSSCPTQGSGFAPPSLSFTARYLLHASTLALVHGLRSAPPSPSTHA